MTYLILALIPTIAYKLYRTSKLIVNISDSIAVTSLRVRTFDHCKDFIDIIRLNVISG